VAVFVPRGVGNSYQTLEDGTAYSYLVNEHWRAGRAYPALDLADPASAIPWPIPLEQCEISEKDRANPRLDAVRPMAPRRVLITGADGQLGRALSAAFAGADRVDVAELDLTDEAAVAAWPWHQYTAVLNTACYTAVDEAETPTGRRAAWAVNAAAPATLARLARQHGLTLVHYSSDYVFDGTAEQHLEDERPSPLGVYGQTKAAGDLAVATAPRHYVLRTSWLVGEGKNFVRTMRDLAARGVSPTVVDDQFGRLTFADELARATRHLLDTGAAYGTYNVTNGGAVLSWFDVARSVFALSGREEADVTPVSTEAYGVGRLLAPRPRNSALDLTKLRGTGFEPEDAVVALRRYCASSSRASASRSPDPSRP
jgi:dTDP-4-dehydrorhamnose 3,5-epimerase